MQRDDGLPVWLALLVDALSEQLGDADNVKAFGASITQASQRGASLTPAASVLILAMLDDLALWAPVAARPAALVTALAAIRTLHEAGASGHHRTPADWKAARRMALAATDALTDPDQLALARCVETAAWDPARSSSCVYDTMRVWRSALSDKTVREFGWTDADDKDMETTLKQLYDSYLLPAPHLKLTVFDLLEEHYPEKALRLSENYRHQRECAARTTRRATDMLLGALGATQGVVSD